jgi:hypothetical protein
MRYLAVVFVLAAAGCSATQQGGGRGAAPFAVAVMGDAPYREDEEARVRRLIDDVNREDMAWVVHIGDIGRFSCSDSLIQARFQLFQRFRHPFVYTPGDNEWTDCHQGMRGGFVPLERLARLREVFFPDPSSSTGGRRLSVTSQSRDSTYAEFVENAAWMEGGVAFMTLHVVGSRNGLAPFGTRTAADDAAQARREAAALEWLRAGFARARQSGSRAVVLAMHADPAFEAPAGADARQGFEPLLAALTEEVQRFEGPVLLIHGDTHIFRVDNPLMNPETGQPFANFTRIEVFGSPFVGWVEVTVDPSGRGPLFSVVGHEDEP